MSLREQAETDALLPAGVGAAINDDDDGYDDRSILPKRRSSIDSQQSDDDTIEHDPSVVLPSRKWVLEPAVLLFCLGMMTLMTVLPQYLYFRISRQYNATANVTRAFVCDSSAERNSSEFSLTQSIQSEASRWSLYRSISSSASALLVIPIFTSSSDFLGRKLALLLPVAGMLLDAALCLAVLLLQLPLSLLVAASAIGGLSGGFGAFLAGVFAYLADTTSKKERAVRIAIVEGTFAVGMFAMELMMGWWMRLSGYNSPVLFSCCMLLLTLLYLLLLVPEVRPRSLAKADGGGASWCSTALRPLTNIASLFRISSSITGSLLLLLLALLLYCAAVIGNSSVTSLYQMNLPFCFDSVAIGYVSAAKILSAQTGTFLGLLILRKWLGAHALSLLGLASAGVSYALTGLATTRWQLYVAAASAVMALLPIPLLRAHMSRLLPGDRQGALFSCIAVLEVAGNAGGAAGLMAVYQNSLATQPGLVYFVCIGLVVGAFVLIAGSACVERRSKAVQLRVTQVIEE